MGLTKLSGFDNETIDKALRLIAVVLLFGWNTLEGAIFENQYPRAFVALYPIPIWRVLVFLALLFGSLWCPSVGLMLAYTIFFYVMDMEVTLEKWG